MIVGINHFTLTAADRDATLEFWCRLIGLVEGPRPDLGFPGAWLYAPGRVEPGAALLHLVFDRPPPPARTGIIDHVALTATGLAAVKARFETRGWPHELRRQRGHGTPAGPWQLFAHDPSGARVELDFDGTETP